MGRVTRTLLLIFITLVPAGLSYTQQTNLSSAPQTQPSASQTPAGAAQEKPEDVYRTSTVLKVTSRLVLVDVVATDHKGNFLTGLKQEDFALSEDGQDQKIGAFSFQSPAETGASASTFPEQSGPKYPVNLPPSVFTNIPKFSSSKTLNIVLLDGLNTTLGNQKYARQELLKFLEKIPADQPVAVYALASKLFLLQDFTTDPALLKKAVKHTDARSSPVVGDSIFNLPSGTLEQMPAQMQAQVVQFAQDNVTFQTDLRVHLTLAALNSLARALAGYRGRKNLIWVSEAFPITLLGNNGDLTAASDKGALNARDYSAEVTKTTNLLVDAQVAVYPVDARGLISNQIYSGLSNTSGTGEYMGRTMSGRSGKGGVASQQDRSNEEDRTSDELLGVHSTMNNVADDTGGKAFYNRNEIDNAMRKSMEDGSTYYTLGYYPANKNWDGKFRKISVRINNPGAKLRYRIGYFATDPQGYSKLDAKKRDLEFGEALNLDFPVSTSLLFQVQVLPPSEQTKNHVSVRFAVDPHQLNFDSQSDGLHHAALDCAVAIYSRKGQALDLKGNTARAALTDEQFGKVMKGHYPCNVQFDLAPNDYVFRVGVRDANSGLIGTANATLTVPAAGAQPAAQEKKQ